MQTNQVTINDQKVETNKNMFSSQWPFNTFTSDMVVISFASFAAAVVMIDCLELQ